MDALGTLLYDFLLLLELLVIKQMKLIESWSCNLPVGLLVKIAQRHGVSQQLVKLLGHFQTDGLFQLQRQQMRNGAVSLNLPCALVNPGLCANSGCAWRNILLHVQDLLAELNHCSVERCRWRIVRSENHDSR